ncbi:ATP synthase subunit e, mitochondrial [Nilaparvata lugens]|uniref:ATP synthase subunit e, mitochondrial n=1 Tax=Nilaparvata lugens TaxID=108931 RepID=UPI00193D6589|nr:ATP synthase subunit e, mitochondrial [Nilaparvata lugens]
MSTRIFAPPVDVSPLIRFSRWSLLFAGIAYGAFWNSRFTKKEAALKPILEKEKAERDAFLAAQKLKTAEEEKAALEALSQPSK